MNAVKSEFLGSGPLAGRITRWKHQRRSGDVRRRVRAVAGGRRAADGGAARRATRAPAGRRPEGDRRRRPGPLRRALPPEGSRRQGRRVPPHHWHVGHPRRALLPLDGRFPTVRSAQGIYILEILSSNLLLSDMSH
jgi:hypothetical protein